MRAYTPVAERNVSKTQDKPSSAVSVRTGYVPVAQRKASLSPVPAPPEVVPSLPKVIDNTEKNKTLAEKGRGVLSSIGTGTKEAIKGVVQDPKTFIKDVAKSTRDVVINPAFNYAVGAGEALPRLLGGVAGLFGSEKGKDLATYVKPPERIPSIGFVTGDVQSPQSKQNKAIEEGVPVGEATRSALFSQVLDNPAGTELNLAAKPILLGGSILAKGIIDEVKLGKSLSKMAKSESPEDIATTLRDLKVPEDKIPTLSTTIAGVNNKGAIRNLITSSVAEPAVKKNYVPVHERGMPTLQTKLPDVLPGETTPVQDTVQATRADRQAEIKSLVAQGKNEEAKVAMDALSKDVLDGKIPAPVREYKDTSSVSTKPKPIAQPESVLEQPSVLPKPKVELTTEQIIKSDFKKARVFDTPEAFDTAIKQGLVKISPEAAAKIESGTLQSFFKEAKYGPAKLQKIELPTELQSQKDYLDGVRDRINLNQEKYDRLRSYVTQKGEFKGLLPEITGKSGKYKGRPDVFARRGDDILDELGFKATDTQHPEELAREFMQSFEENKASYSQALKDFHAKKRVFLNENASNNATERLLNKGDKIVKEDINKYQAKSIAQKKEQIKQGEYLMQQAVGARRAQYRALRDRFNLTDKELAEIRRGRDITAMTEDEFKAFMKDSEMKAEAVAELRDQFIQTQAVIYQNELKKTENLQQALKLPPIEKMNLDQLKQFEEALKPFEHGDEFLGVRQLETLKNTDIAGIRTHREAREAFIVDVNKMREKEGLKPITLAELPDIRVKELDRFRYDPALARQNPLFSLMVEEKNKAFLSADYNFFKIKEELNTLISAARASRKRGLLDKAIPTDKAIFTYLEAPQAEKYSLAQNMSREEIQAAEYIKNLYAEARDYLLQHDVLKNYRKDYITHIRRGFWEGVRESGTVPALREIFDKYKQDEAVFNILNQKTGEVLPLEKFFQFSMKRTGNLAPTQNVASAVEAYFRSFEKKKALDALVPKLDVYAHSLSPKTLTPRGLEFDDSIKRFVKEWVNTKKGRVVDTGFVKPGGKVDWFLRSGQALTRILDLGFSIPTGMASQAGEQVATFVHMGTRKYALGASRLATAKGREITNKYVNFVGEKFLDRVTDNSKGLADKFGETMFGLFSAAARRANQIELLGQMSPAEFAKGEISIERLASIQKDMGRYRAVEGYESILGKTSPGKAATQYKASWAVPLLSTTVDNLTKVSKMLASRDKNVIKTKEFQELLRASIISGAIGLSTYGFLQSEKNKTAKDRTFMEQLAYKSATDSLSLIQALDPSIWTATPRLASFVNDLAVGIKQTVMLQTNKDGELSGVNKLQRMATPALVRQFENNITGASPTTTTKSKGGVGLPKLPQLPSLPKLPKLPTIGG